VTCVFNGVNSPKREDAWGVHLRFAKRKDAGVFYLKWGYARIYFDLRKPYSGGTIKKGECHERFRANVVALHCSPHHPIWDLDADWKVVAQARIQVLARVRLS
jgi:hypothetical protein